MKKCKWCNSDIEDKATICPYCKAEYKEFDKVETNYVEKFLEKYPNGRTTPTWKRENKQLIIACPTCGSINTKQITIKSRFNSIVLLGVFSNKFNKTFECKNCGYTW